MINLCRWYMLGTGATRVVLWLDHSDAMCGKTSIKVQPPNCTLFRTHTVSCVLNDMLNNLKCENVYNQLLMQGVTKWRYIPTSSVDRFRRSVVEMSEMAEARACNVDGTGTRRT